MKILLENLSGEALIKVLTQSIRHLEVDIKEVKVLHNKESAYQTPKQCYNNTYLEISDSRDSNLKYVLGFVIFSGIPIEHAWVYNSSSKTYHDNTLNPEKNDTYFSVCEFDLEVIDSYVDKFDHAPSLYDLNRFLVKN